MTDKELLTIIYPAVNWLSDHTVVVMSMLVATLLLGSLLFFLVRMIYRYLTRTIQPREYGSWPPPPKGPPRNTAQSRPRGAPKPTPAPPPKKYYKGKL